MESIKKLRNWAADEHTVYCGLEMETFTGKLTSYQKQMLDRIINDLEAEIAEKHMELPVDVDGVPIHEGDKLRSLYSETEYTALGFWFDFDCGIWQVMVSSEQAMSGNMLRHVKPDPVKELLEEFGD